jgi:hypothetical protein
VSNQRTNNDLQKSSPKSDLSVLDARQYEMSQMSRTISFFNRIIICYSSNLSPSFFSQWLTVCIKNIRPSLIFNATKQVSQF